MKRLIIIISFLCSVVILPSSLWAIGNASSYKVTIVSIQLKDANTGSWVTISSPNETIDLAAVSAGATAASLLSDVAIPLGTYDNFRMVLSETMLATGTDGANNTLSGGAVTIQGTGANSASTSTWGGWPPPASVIETSDSVTAGTAGEVTYTLDLDVGDADSTISIERSSDLSTPITINGSSIVTMSFDFDTQSTVLFINNAAVTGGGGTDLGGANGAMVFSPPQTGTAFTITVDGTTTTINESDMVFNF